MPTRLIEYEGRPLLDLSSYARKGPGRRDHLSPAELELIGRTANRVPEVMVKVLTRGGQDLAAVRRHLEYLDRNGALEFETDDGQRLSGKGIEQELLDDWDLDIEEDRRSAALEAWPGRSLPKVVHKVLFSMPPGTPPQKVLQAVKNFAREEFGLKHRYAMVLHTDEPHPHVHMLIKAVSERGGRLNIRKATLRHWRSEFARHLRELGVPANATERAVRGENRTQKLDGLYRADRRGDSWRVRERAEEVRRERLKVSVRTESDRETLIKTRQEIVRGWREVSKILAAQGQRKVAAEVEDFVSRMPPPMSDRDAIAAEVMRGRHTRVR